MSDLYGLQTGGMTCLGESDDNPELSDAPRSAAVKWYSTAPASGLKKASLDRSSLALRIQDNLDWAQAFDPLVSPFPSVDLWSEIQPLWTKPPKEFVAGLFDVLLGRPPEPDGLEKACAALADGASRVAMARTVALSAEAVEFQLDLSWLPHLDAMESEEIWEKVRSLWDAPDEVFVAGLYPLLLDRDPEPAGLCAHCEAMKTGASRACVVRAFAQGDEAQFRRLDVSWLPRLDNMPTPQAQRNRFSFHRLKSAFRQWREGKKSGRSAGPLRFNQSFQSAGPAAEGRPA